MSVDTVLVQFLGFGLLGGKGFQHGNIPQSGRWAIPPTRVVQPDRQCNRSDSQTGSLPGYVMLYVTEQPTNSNGYLPYRLCFHGY